MDDQKQIELTPFTQYVNLNVVESKGVKITKVPALIPKCVMTSDQPWKRKKIPFFFL